jgi:hypothetical protein
VEKAVLVVGPVYLSHEEIKLQVEDSSRQLLIQEPLLAHETSNSLVEASLLQDKEIKELTFKGLPADHDFYSPLLLLVPALTEQSHSVGVSMEAVAKLMENLLIVSFNGLRDQRTEFQEDYEREYEQLHRLWQKVQSLNQSGSPIKFRDPATSHSE